MCDHIDGDNGQLIAKFGNSPSGHRVPYYQLDAYSSIEVQTIRGGDTGAWMRSEAAVCGFELEDSDGGWGKIYVG